MTPAAIIKLVFGFILKFFLIAPWAFFGLTKPKEFDSVESISTVEIDEDGNIIKTFDNGGETLIVTSDSSGNLIDQNGNIFVEQTESTPSSVQRNEVLYIRSVPFGYNITPIFFQTYKLKETTYGEVGVSQPDRDLYAEETRKLIKEQT